ncbi:hypothetical protein [Vulcanisaeta distributa]|uniref:Cobalamin (Vitamin B12) biosynthesis CbiX protein n=1 Tax=Vulcanisaeta distributa (strain DSM 14429 / JCM 11212 / NBRC 100878 / IC-017) TaxID=572478 RepID=E1QQ21_VULDI|nr:hypothetical protein [Vulcanisaeta distributa]ADN50393.1 conserved hypothetical protein [Vulcanisaeta distributa DSM 14429]
MRIVIVLHGSRDPDYLSSVESFAKNVGVSYAFTSYSEPSINNVIGDIYIPLFIGYGKDYERAVAITGFETPPMLEWPYVRDFLLSLGPGLYVFHGENDPRFIDSVSKLSIQDIVFLKIEPMLEDYLINHCPGKVIPVVFTQGVIYKEISTVVRKSCSNTEVLKPLFELQEFITYFRNLLPWLLQNTRRVR